MWWWHVLRIFNLVEVLAVFFLAYRHRARWWCRKPSCWRSMSVTLLLTGAIGYGSVDALLHDVPGGSRVVIYTLALLAPLMHVVFWPGVPAHKEHHPAGLVPSRPGR
jgi:hypothetical protein